MEKNVGGYDRWTRWLMGAGLFAYGLSASGWRRYLALGMGGSLMGTAASEKCLVNKMCGIDTSAQAAVEKEKTEVLVDETIEDSFPASDAPAWTVGKA